MKIKMGVYFIDLFKQLSCLLLLLEIIKAQQACVTPAYEDGFCVPYQECPLANDLTQNYGSYSAIPKHFLNYLNKSKCSVGNQQPIRLCCKLRNGNPNPQIATTVVTTANPVEPAKMVNSRSTADLDYTKDYLSQLNQQGVNILNELTCGKPEANRVVGGNETKLAEYPWMTLLRYDTPGQEYNCGGSLISKRFILTAAHCVNKPTYPVIGVVLGEHDLTTDPDCRTRGRKVICNPPIQNIDVEDIIIHPSYSERYKVNDIALIKLKQDAQIDKHIKPVCLPITQISFDGSITDFYIAGWGSTEHTSLNSNVLLKAPVSKKDLSVCGNKFNIALNQKHLCAGDLITGRDTCRGDSGGPLVGLHFFNEEKRYVQYGIVASGGEACKLSQELPGVYTNVITFMPWITSNIV